jgi:predicted RNA-binding protein (virulence factor B family)
VFAKALLIAGPQDAEQVRREAGSRLTYLAVDRERRIWGNLVSTEVVDVNISPLSA